MSFIIPEVDRLRTTTTMAIKSATARRRVRVVVAGILLPLLWYCPSGAQQMSKRSVPQSNIDAQCTANLKRIYKLIKLYLHRSGGVLGFPADLDAIELMASDRKLFYCPGDKQTKTPAKKGTADSSYLIVNNPLKGELVGTSPDKIAIVAEKTANHDGKRFVLFYDGSIRAFDEAGFAKLKNNAFVDR